jgi:hypothetical protein
MCKVCFDCTGALRLRRRAVAKPLASIKIILFDRVPHETEPTPEKFACERNERQSWTSLITIILPRTLKNVRGIRESGGLLD